MSSISEDKLSLVRKLYYKDSMSMNELAKQLRVSLNSVVYFMRKHSLPRRSSSENEKIKFAKKPISFALKTCNSNYDKNLKIAGVMLYWAEGYKSPEDQTIDLANSDPHMVTVFLNFLRRICGVEDGRLRVQLYCYSNQNVKKLIDFWSELIRIPKSQFTKPYVRKDYQNSKISKMKYGMVHIRYSDKKLWLVIMGWMKKYIEKLSVGTQAVNEGSL